MPSLPPLVRIARWILLFGVAAAVPLPAAPTTPAFVSAKPIWPEGREREMDLSVAFRAVFPAPADGRATLRLAGHVLYRVFVNGKFAGHGPARAAHGFFRVDEWDLAPLLRPGSNIVAVEVAGYNATSYALLNAPSFLQAEVVSGATVLASTAGTGRRFEAAVLRERVQRVQRYSFQRPFSEIWRLTPGWDAWRTEAKAAFTLVACTVVDPKQLLSRGVPYPQFAVHAPVVLVGQGTVEKGAPPTKPWRDRALTSVGPKLSGFPEAELESIPSLELQAVHTATTTTTASAPYAGGRVTLAANSWATFDFGICRAGFIGAHIEVRKPTRLFFTFDEILTDNDVSFTRMGCVNIVACELAPGTYDFSSFEPYGLRYLKLIVLEGDCEVSQPALRELNNPEAGRATFAASDERLSRIFAAARETFAQNAVDIFMDCPSRERAGWLCDSYFTARVAAELCGTTSVEKNFLENFVLPPSFAALPAGMLPMCYPADHLDGVFIPQWALWLVLELEEYAARSGDRALVAAFGPRLRALLTWFKGYENADGLLEQMPGWNFVEWSKANSYMSGVNYPTNMLYAGALAAMDRMYGDPALATKAEKIRATIRQQSFDGEFFVDNAERKDGELRATRNRSEACQDYAFYFDVATPATHAALWRTLTTDFGPQRATTNAWPEVAPANAFIGNQLRFELLSRAGLRQQILDEATDSWLYMADRTGTLWENVQASASCDHGFASHAAHVFFRDILGLQKIDPVGRTLKVCLPDVKLEWCRGAVPTPDGPVELSWRHDGAKLVYQLHAPAGWKVDVVNESGREIKRE